MCQHIPTQADATHTLHNTAQMGTTIKGCKRRWGDGHAPMGDGHAPMMSTVANKLGMLNMGAHQPWTLDNSPRSGKSHYRCTEPHS